MCALDWIGLTVVFPSLYTYMVRTWARQEGSRHKSQVLLRGEWIPEEKLDASAARKTPRASQFKTFRMP